MIELEIGRMPSISGIFITHAHIGHYLGLLDLGLEIMNTDKIPVFVMPSMENFLKENAPFTQLIELDNIKLKPLMPNKEMASKENLSITPLLVPHRNEFSETVGFQINSIDLIRKNDFALLDGTFYDSTELENRNMADIPHPFIKDSLEIFSLLELVDRKKVYFTHLNHTNPAIHNSSLERLEIISQGFNVAEDGMIFKI